MVEMDEGDDDAREPPPRRRASPDHRMAVRAAVGGRDTLVDVGCGVEVRRGRPVPTDGEVELARFGVVAEVIGGLLTTGVQPIIRGAGEALVTSRRLVVVFWEGQHVDGPLAADDRFLVSLRWELVTTVSREARPSLAERFAGARVSITTGWDTALLLRATPVTRLRPPPDLRPDGNAGTREFMAEVVAAAAAARTTAADPEEAERLSRLAAEGYDRVGGDLVARLDPDA